MKKYKYIYLLLILLLTTVSCSNGDIEMPDIPDPSEEIGQFIEGHREIKSMIIDGEDNSESYDGIVIDIDYIEWLGDTLSFFLEPDNDTIPFSNSDFMILLLSTMANDSIHGEYNGSSISIFNLEKNYDAYLADSTNKTLDMIIYIEQNKKSLQAIHEYKTRLIPPPPG